MTKVCFAALIVMVGHVYGSSAVACKCNGYSLRQTIGLADVVFFGTVMSSRTIVVTEPIAGWPLPLQIPGKEYQFQIKASWRGPLSAVVAVKAPSDPGSCGIEFQVGRDFFVAGTQTADGIFTGRCSYISKNLSETSKILGPPTFRLGPFGVDDPDSGLASAHWLAAATMTSVVAAVIAVVKYRRRKRRRLVPKPDRRKDPRNPGVW